LLESKAQELEEAGRHILELRHAFVSHSDVNHVLVEDASLRVAIISKDFVDKTLSFQKCVKASLSFVDD
jgi:hypothetical protein